MINVIKLLLIYFRNPGMSVRAYNEWVDAWERNLDGEDISDYLHQKKVDQYIGRD